MRELQLIAQVLYMRIKMKNGVDLTFRTGRRKLNNYSL